MRPTTGIGSVPSKSAAGHDPVTSATDDWGRLYSVPPSEKMRQLC